MTRIQLHSAKHKKELPADLFGNTITTNNHDSMGDDTSSSKHSSKHRSKHDKHEKRDKHDRHRDHDDPDRKHKKRRKHDDEDEGSGSKHKKHKHSKKDKDKDRKRDKDGENKMQIVDDDPTDDGMWVEKDITMDGEHVGNFSALILCIVHVNKNLGCCRKYSNC